MHMTIMARKSAHARILAPLLLALLLLTCTSSASAEIWEDAASSGEIWEDASSSGGGGGGGNLGEATDAYTYIPASANATSTNFTITSNTVTDTNTTTTGTTAAGDGEIADVDYGNSIEAQESVGVDATQDDEWVSISFLHRERGQRGRKNLRR